MLKLKLFGGGGIWIPETLADLAVFLDPAPKFSESVGEGFEPPEPLRTLQFSRLPLLSTQPSHRVYEKLAEWFLVRGKTAPFSRSGTPPLNAVCVRKNSNRFRPKFVGRAEFPPNPPFRPSAEATLSDWTISSFSFRFWRNSELRSVWRRILFWK